MNDLETLELEWLAQKGDFEAFDSMAKKCYDLVHSVSLKYCGIEGNAKD